TRSLNSHIDLARKAEGVDRRTQLPTRWGTVGCRHPHGWMDDAVGVRRLTGTEERLMRTWTGLLVIALAVGPGYVHADEAKKAPAADTKAKDAAKDASKDAKDAPKDAPKDKAKEATKDAAKDATKDAAKDKPKEAAKDASKEAAKDAPKEAAK